MIKNSKQDWTVGAQIKVGFLSLTVVAAVATPGDSKPDAYALSSKTAFYRFIPHNGLEKISADEARSMVEAGKRYAAQAASKAIATARQQAEHSAALAAILG